jgi:hypothetical protein
VWPRDFSVLCVKRVVSESKVLCLAKSVESDLCPVDSACVRGKMPPSGFLGISRFASLLSLCYLFFILFYFSFIYGFIYLFMYVFISSFFLSCLVAIYLFIYVFHPLLTV